MIKSNHIPACGWVTHKLENNYMTEVIPEEWKFWSPHQAPHHESLASGGVPRASGFEGQWGSDHRNSTGMGETETPLLDVAHKVLCTPGRRGKSNDLIRAWARPTCWYWRVSCRGRGKLWLTAGEKIMEAVVLENTHWQEPSCRSPFSHKTWPHPMACMLQCWNTSGQTTKRVGTQPHPSADRLPKVILSPQLPNEHTTSHGPAHQRDKTKL